MRKKPTEPIYEKGRFFVMPAKYGYDVFENTHTHAKKCAVIGYTGQIGLDRAKKEIERRLGAPSREIIFDPSTVGKRIERPAGPWERGQ